MPTKTYRLDDDAVRVLREFQGQSTSLSDAIRNMERCIKLTKPSQNVTQPTQFATGNTLPTQPVTPQVTQFDTTYWKKLSDTVDSCIERAKRY